MGNLKIVDADKLDADLLSIADAIRKKSGKTQSLKFPDEFKTAIDSISTSTSTSSNVLGDYWSDVLRKHIESVSLPKLVDLGQDAFASCDNLSSIHIPEVTTIGKGAFVDCIALETISLPKLVDLGQDVFMGCGNLSSVSNLANLKTIHVGAFDSCVSLTVIDLPVVEAIAPYAFVYCEALETVILRNSNMCQLIDEEYFDSEEWFFEEGYFEDSGIAYGTGYIYVPAALVDAYKADSKWSQYASQIRAIEDYPEITGG